MKIQRRRKTIVERIDCHLSYNMAAFFQNLPEEPPNSILGVAFECKNDPFPNKINLTIGAYRDDEGNPFVLPCVREAEEALLTRKLDHEYLVQDGLAEFDRCAQLLMFGEESAPIRENRVYTIQAVAGTAAVRLGADFIHRILPNPKVLMPDVTWPNHPVICKSAGIEVGTYRYLDSTGVGFDFEGMLADLQIAPENSVVLFHSCAHNPTGIDPSDAQWVAILEVVQSRHLLPFFDNAYQGFVSGDPTKDAFAVRLFASAGLELIAACSFSKNFGLYGERTGALHVVLKDAKEVPNTASIIRALARPLYSTCPSYGARIVAHILSDPARSEQWRVECKEMANRLNYIRKLLYDTLVRLNVKGKWEHIIQQRGMFSYSGIRGPAVQRLKSEHHIYLLMDGRISLAGLNNGNIEHFAQALAQVLGTN